jgi:hypothetical protein
VTLSLIASILWNLGLSQLEFGKFNGVSFDRTVLLFSCLLLSFPIASSHARGGHRLPCKSTTMHCILLLLVLAVSGFSQLRSFPTYMLTGASPLAGGRSSTRLIAPGPAWL